MDLIVSKLQTSTDNEDDDYGSYFLQPASSPYNIAEKIQQANIDLFSNTVTMAKTSKVTFKDELATYEPELTDDDVNSIESETTEIEIVPENQPQILEYKSSNVINLNIFDINEEEELVEEFLEEIELDENEDEFPVTDNNFNSVEIIECEEKEDNQYVLKEDDSKTIRLSSSENTKSSKRKRSRKKSPQIMRINSNIVECRNHCIEKFDFDLSMSIRKLEIREKPINCPLLKLQRRKCCDENKAKNPLNLPCYNGLRSEYGLSSAALEKRERRKEIIKLKEQKRQQLLQEYRNRKNQQNEEVFCQWLKDVARRKAQQKQKIDNKCKSIGAKQPLSPNVINFPTKANEKVKGRPKTADEFVPKHSVKRARRPHTSPSCVFIEVPQKLLERGIHIGDLMVTNANFNSKKMHILTVSS